MVLTQLLPSTPELVAVQPEGSKRGVRRGEGVEGSVGQEGKVREVEGGEGGGIGGDGGHTGVSEATARRRGGGGEGRGGIGVGGEGERRGEGGCRAAEKEGKAGLERLRTLILNSTLKTEHFLGHGGVGVWRE